MHREIEWISPADSYILRFMAGCHCLQGDPATLTPKAIGLNVPYTRKHIGNRCRELAEHGLVERHGRGEYSATGLGVKFANGELTADDLREL